MNFLNYLYFFKKEGILIFVKSYKKVRIFYLFNLSDWHNFYWLKIKLKLKNANIKERQESWFFNVLEFLRITNFLNLIWVKIQFQVSKAIF